MKKAIAYLAGSVALVASQAAAAADYITPEAPYVFEGVVAVSKGISLDCDTTLTVSGPNDSADTSPAFDHTDVANTSANISLAGGTLGLCASVNVASISAGDITYDSSGLSGGTFTLHDVFVTTITPGNCEGDITGTWDESAQTLTVSGTLPAVSGSDCTMNGTLDLVSPSSVDVNDSLDSDHNPNH